MIKIKELFEIYEKDLRRKLTEVEENMIGGAYCKGKEDAIQELLSSHTKSAINTYNKSLEQYEKKYGKNPNFQYIKID